MSEFWAAIGRLCVDEVFHLEVFKRGKAAADIYQKPVVVDDADIPDLLPYLKGQGHRLTREERIALNYVVTVLGQTALGEHVPVKLLATGKLDDRYVKAVRDLHSAPQVMRNDFEFCAALGLACIDTKFRVEMFTAATKSLGDFESFLKTGGASPGFMLDAAQVAVLYGIAKDLVMYGAMKSFEAAKWEQPSSRMVFGACAQGYSTKPFSSLVQQNFAAVLASDENAALKAELIAKGLLIPDITTRSAAWEQANPLPFPE